MQIQGERKLNMNYMYAQQAASQLTCSQTNLLPVSAISSDPHQKKKKCIQRNRINYGIKQLETASGDLDAFYFVH